MVFGREAEWIVLGHVAHSNDCLAKGAVFVVGQDVGRIGGVEQLADVAVGVRGEEDGRHGGRPSKCGGQQAADAAGSLEVTA